MLMQSTAFDRAVRDAVSGHGGVVEAVSGVVTWLGSGWVVFPALVLATILLWSRLGGRALMVLGTAVAAALVNTLLKLFLQRARPTTVLNLFGVSHSLPSGHAATATGAYVFLVFVLARERIVARGTAVVFGVAVPLLVGVSRVVLDVHWATDVVAGWLLGLAVVSAAVVVYVRTGPGRAEPAP